MNKSSLDKANIQKTKFSMDTIILDNGNVNIKYDFIYGPHILFNITKDNKDIERYDQFRFTQTEYYPKTMIFYLTERNKDNFKELFEWSETIDEKSMFNILQEYKKFINDYYKLIDKRNKYIDKHQIITYYDFLNYIQSDELYVFNDNYDGICGGITNTIKDISGWDGRFIYINYSSACIDGKTTYISHNTFKIPYFDGVKKLESFGFHKPTDNEKRKLLERSKIVINLIDKSTYSEYNGNLYSKSWFGVNKFNSDGRIMIDSNSFKRFNNNYENNHTNDVVSDLDDNDDFIYTYPSVVFGYSFKLKKWGEFQIDNLKSINYREEAFDLLEIDNSRKKIVRALVETKAEFKDLITGKGTGTIFLLYGEPGVGKTLTAEAVSEILHKPLYSVTVGELGTTVEDLERKLSTVLEIATIWNAVLLIDEADIFMEQRDNNNIIRNAMVSIFLRLLEYYPGVLFLTTNRFDNIDPAFRSRISMSFQYKKLSTHVQKNIWKNIIELQGYKLQEDDYKILTEYDLNGREIKNVIKNSIAITKAYNEKFDINIIKELLKQIY